MTKHVVGMAFLAVVAVGCFSMTAGAPTAIDRAAVELNCAKDQIKVVRSTDYSGGGLYVVDACGQQVSYECMGTVCQKACSYSAKPTDFTGDGEMDGSYHQLVVKRAVAEFGCAADQIKQIRHSDSMGSGLYIMAVCGNEVKYNCAGSVCNLTCN